ncbi:MAG: peptidylprolyl isomerase [Cytophagales bacterium]|nr:peptidylprolyl isomerase [Cytophagales bacterium]
MKNSLPTLKLPVMLVLLAILLGGYFYADYVEQKGKDNASAYPVVEIKTAGGLIAIELYPDKAPVTVANFLKYVKGGYLNNASFYRAVRLDNQQNKTTPIQVLQGGLWYHDSTGVFAAVPLETTEETGILHRDAVVSMARDADPNTATSEFFICIGNNYPLDKGGRPNSKGYAAFGKVIQGMDLVRKYQEYPAKGQLLEPRVDFEEVRLR